MGAVVFYKHVCLTLTPHVRYVLFFFITALISAYVTFFNAYERHCETIATRTRATCQLQRHFYSFDGL